MNNFTKTNDLAGAVKSRLILSTVMLALPLSTAFAADRDGDGLENAADNCVHVWNAGQRDSDADGIGNRCDPDFNNNLLVDDYDLDYMRAAFFGHNPLADLNGDGLVDFVDLAILKSYYGDAPGGVPRTVQPGVAAGDQSATIRMQPADVTVPPGDTFLLDVILDFNGVTTIGGGFDVSFDSSAMAFVGWTAAGVGDPGFAREPDILDGLLSGIAVGEFDVGLTGIQNLGVLEFQLVDSGATQVVPGDTDSIAGPFVDFNTFEVINVEYTGATVNGEVPQEPTVIVDPEDVDSGFVMVGESSTADVTVTSAGVADLVLGDVAGNDSLAPPFAIVADNCSGQTLVTAETCTVTVQFAPTGVSSFADSFEIASNATESPVVTVNVSGEGIAVPNPEIVFNGNASPLDLGRVQLGQFGERFLRIRNAGDANLVIGNVGDTEALEPPFLLTSDTCSNMSLAPDATCKIRVRFEGEVGNFSDSLNIPSNDTDAPQLELAVLAEGISPPPRDFGGTVRGLGQAALVACVNITTGERVSRLVGTFTPWSCYNIGLTINPGDSIGVLLSGSAQ